MPVKRLLGSANWRTSRMKNLYLTTFALTVPRRIRQKPYPHIICLLIESLERAQGPDPIQQCPQRCPPDSIMKLPNNFPRTARKAVRERVKYLATSQITQLYITLTK